MAWLTPWLNCDGLFADCLITLSETVATQLAKTRVIGRRRIVKLFHPDLRLSSLANKRQLERHRPVRLLFFGRVLPYKGLHLLVEAVEQLHKEGVNVDLGVAGEGDLQPLAGRLASMGAEVINRWVSEDEATQLLNRYDAMVCPHIEASQSGVAALAFGNCMPVVATPVGGLTEQVVSGKSGVLSQNATAWSLAEAIRRLVVEPSLYEQISSYLSETRKSRSMEQFVAGLISAVNGTGLNTDATRRP